ncbi:DUF2924 domain-containing protein [Qipengyuania spongiae]|uniref:DUF2924 domain-containing protein n=1 Tax=Qipengyuania spongiae TaxID=2909673 RepID=A0ABY5T1J4_9SPHN|nr:DUF2924 domain-containing protein [Qipengyuania spongiae]UVI39196.1 DUF2924 domain-containing protein [Qipengyuania spongiae]
MDAALLQRLETADLRDLRDEWERRYGAAPRLRSADLLRRTLAWRIQAGAEGGLDRATRRLLAGKPAGPENLLSAGTVITREWKGERHDVEVAEGGFLYRDERWNSLSEVARAITGTRWNGPRFFGMREVG